MVKLKFDSQAVQDLDNIFDFIAKDNPTAAKKYLRNLYETTKNFSTQPHAGRIEPELALRLKLSIDGVRSFLYRNHRCYYALNHDEMRVLGFIDTRRDIIQVLKRRFESD